MLVLSRKPGEKIHIGEGIEITVLAVKGGRVRVGIAAPQDCRIVRAECLEVARRQREALLVGCRQ